MSTGFDSVAPDVTASADRIATLVESIIAKDERDADAGKQQIQDNNKCPRDEVERFEIDAASMVSKLRTAAPRPKSEWTTHFSESADKPASLHDVDADYELLITALSDIHARVQTLSDQTNWTGQGADAYMKQLPYQAAATGELWSMASTERSGLDQTTMTLQAIMQAVSEGFSGCADELESIRQSVAIPDVYYQRTANATAVCDGFADDLHDLGLGEQWSEALAQLDVEYQTAEQQLHMFADTDIWPSATNASSPTPNGQTTTPLPQVPSNPVVVTTPGTGIPPTDTDSGMDINDARYD